MSTQNDVIEKRKEKIKLLKESGIALFPNDYKVTHTTKDIKKLVEKISDGIEEDATFSVAGRIMAVNRFGKSAFIRFRDRSGQLQAYIRTDQVGDDAYALFKKMDIGDFIGMSGTMFQTKTGEWTLLANFL